MTSKDDLAQQFGAPANYPIQTREAVARLVGEPIDQGMTLDDLYVQLQNQLRTLLGSWLEGEPDYPAAEALSAAQLALDFVRFALTTREVATMLSEPALPALAAVVDVVELAGIRTGDWSWCATIADFLYAVALEADGQRPTDPPAN